MDENMPVKISDLINNLPEELRKEIEVLEKNWIRQEIEPYRRADLLRMLNIKRRYRFHLKRMIIVVEGYGCIYVFGNTYPYRHVLRQLGFVWVHGEWRKDFPDEDVAAITSAKEEKFNAYLEKRTEELVKVINALPVDVVFFEYPYVEGIEDEKIRFEKIE